MKKFQNKPAGIINSADLKTFKGKLVYWGFFTVLVLVCIACALPYVWALLSGFKGSQEIYKSLGFFPKNLTVGDAWQRIREAADTMNFFKASLNSIFLAAGKIAFVIVIDGLGGYVLSRLKPKGIKFVFVLVVWTMMMPAQIRTVPYFISLLNFPFVSENAWEISLLNTFWPMILSAAASAFNVILFKNHFDSVSISLVEAARIDGCGNARIFTKIMLPLSVPIMVYVAITLTKAAFSEFFMPYLVLSNEEMQTLPVKVFMLRSDSTVKMNTSMLALALSSIPGLLLFTVFQKYIIGGVNVGGVKE